MARKKATQLILLLSLLCILLVLLAGTDSPTFGSYRINHDKDIELFLTSLGWSCDLTKLTEQKTVLPQQFDDVFIAYNAIQIKQNCDLTPYAGKEVTVYTLPITNYDDSNEAVFATIIVYKGKVIGGDIHAAAMDGFIYGFK